MSHSTLGRISTDMKMPVWETDLVQSAANGQTFMDGKSRPKRTILEEGYVLCAGHIAGKRMVLEHRVLTENTPGLGMTG